MWSFASDMSFLRLSAARSVCQAMRRCTRAVAFQNAPTARDRRWKIIRGFEAERGTAAVTFGGSGGGPPSTTTSAVIELVWMVEKAELVALLLEDGWRPPQEGSDDETDDEERTRLC